MIKFIMIQNDDFDWKLGHGSLKTATGPITDQEDSSPAGGLAFIDSSYPRHPGDIASLKLDKEIKTDVNSPLCFSFYLNLFGSGLGSLAVIQQVNSFGRLYGYKLCIIYIQIGYKECYR